VLAGTVVAEPAQPQILSGNEVTEHSKARQPDLLACSLWRPRLALEAL